MDEKIDKPHTLAVGDRVRKLGIDGEVVENDGSGFFVRWGGVVGNPERFVDGEDWPFEITHLEDIL